MDGVSILTQDVISPGESFDYKYTVPDAGTYWYQAHYLSIEQVSRGLFGALIVDENTPPDVDHDIIAMTFDALLATDGRFDPVYHQAHYATGGRLGNYRRLFMWDATIQTGQRVRLRLINPSVDRVFVLNIDGLDGAVVALDGMPLAATRSMAALTLAPGQRADVIADVTGNITVSDIGDGPAVVLGEMGATQGSARRSSPIQLLPEPEIPALGRVSQSATIVMQGGAAGSDHAGYGTWALNDVTGLGRTPLLTANQGDTVQITLVNNTAFDHGMHLHGMHFWETGPAGNPTVLRDTTLVRAGQSRDILCVLDNPGSWLLHCHMLSHSADGMATWIRVN
jgi:FtsP/CotA-like multicopper oxidase with cupredoxin domain